MKWGYANGYAEGRLHTVQEYERVLAILREELADARQLAATQSGRADAAVDLLLGHLGARAISLAGRQEDAAIAERRVAAVKAINSVPSMDEDLPFGDPNGRFSSVREAALFEDVAGVEG